MLAQATTVIERFQLRHDSADSELKGDQSKDKSRQEHGDPEEDPMMKRVEESVSILPRCRALLSVPSREIKLIYYRI